MSVRLFITKISKSLFYSHLERGIKNGEENSESGNHPRRRGG